MNSFEDEPDVRPQPEEAKTVEELFNFGLLHLEGIGCPRNEREARRLFLRAAEAGSPAAEFQLAIMCRDGVGMVEDPAEAFHRMQKAAQAGLPEAQIELARMYLDGVGTGADPEQALHWLHRAAEMHLTEADYELGNLYLEGRIVSKNSHVALVLFERAARRGFAPAQFSVGRCYFLGLGTVQDLEKACAWTLKAARFGLPEAQFQSYLILSQLYQDTSGETWLDEEEWAAAESGEEAKEDADEGDEQAPISSALAAVEADLEDEGNPIYWLKKAAAAGFPRAQYKLATLLLQVPNEGARQRAFELLQESAENGDGAAQYALGHHYLSEKRNLEGAIYWFGKAAAQGKKAAARILHSLFNGGSVENRKISEARWLEMFAEAGCPEAQYELAHLWFLGVDVPKDPRRAVTLLRAAAQQGDRRAQLRLAFILDVGDGVPKNREEAAFWRNQGSV